jgi:hypothetical protein
MSFFPVPNLNVNFKILYNSVDVTDRRYLLFILHKLYTISYDFVQNYEVSDLDVDKLVEILKHGVSDLRKQLPRCEEAFQIILNEAETSLRGSFDTYYKDYLASGDMGSITQNFIQSVCSKDYSNTKVRAQFIKIMRTLNANSEKIKQVPALHKMFTSILKEEEGEGDAEGDAKEDAEE